MTNEQPSIFPPFPIQGNGPAPAVAAEPAAPKRARGPRRGAKRKAKSNGQRKRKQRSPAQPAAPEAATPKAARRARKPRALKIDISTAMGALAGLAADDAKLLEGILQALQPFSKKARQRIVGALSKVVVD